MSPDALPTDESTSSNDLGQPALGEVTLQRHDALRLDEADDLRASHAVRVVWVVSGFLLIFFLWAWFFHIAEVSSGMGKVIPSSREQHIQSQDGGILAELMVREGDVVEQGQVLARLDQTRNQSSVSETVAKYVAGLARRARLLAEVTEKPVVDFPEELKDYPQLKQSEQALFDSRRKGLQDALRGLRKARDLVASEVDITRQLVTSGAASKVELIRLRRELADVEMRLDNAKSDFIVDARQNLSVTSAEVNSLEAIVRGRRYSLDRTIITSPVRAVVKHLDVTTIGGVVPQNGSIMTLVPLDDQLLVEARISPRDIAFIHPDQEALVKVTAYDYSIYGGLPGRVVMISPDTIRDEVDPKQVYYQVYIRTDTDELVNKAGKHFPITPGMVTTTDIQTGTKTVWDYLTKPFNKASEALRER